jgi:hypothetical protein
MQHTQAGQVELQLVSRFVIKMYSGVQLWDQAHHVISELKFIGIISGSGGGLRRYKKMPV